MSDIPNTSNLYSHKPYEFITLDKERYFVVKGTLPTYRLNYFILINSDDINRPLYLSILIYCSIIIICILLNIFLCHLLTKPISLHLNFLIERMKQFGSSKDLTITQTNLYSDRLDEIVLLHQQFYEMATEIQELIKSNYLNQLLIKYADLTALENQLNPHFLYNILDSINIW